MSHRFAAVVTATLWAAMLTLGCVAALLMHLELAAGPMQDLLAAETFNRLFTTHGAVMLFGVMRPGLLAPIALLHVARAREAERLAGGLGAWLSSFGALVLVGVAILAVAVAVQPFELALPWLRWIGRLGSVADLGLGLGVLIGVVGLDHRRSPVLNFTVVLVAAAQVLLGAVDLLASDDARTHTTSAFGPLSWTLLVGLGVVSASRSEHSPRVTNAAVAALVLVAVYSAVWRTFAGADPRPLAWAGWIQLAGQLAALTVLARSLRGGLATEPTRDVVAVLIASFLLMFPLRLYVDSLRVDVHIHDSYIVVADFHLVALLGPALGGPLALRHFSPQRYANAPTWLRRGTPWLIGLALIWFGVALLMLGHQGMPRRYYAYLPEYLAGHRSAAAAGVTLCAGLLMECVLWIRGRPARAG